MATGLDISLIGDAELQRLFVQLPAKVQRSIVRKAFRVAGKTIATAAKSAVPVRTGALRKSMKVRATKPRRGVVGVRVVTGIRQQLGISKNTSGYYPAAIEFGTKFIKARPYLRPAIQKNRTAILSSVGASIKSAVESR